MPEIREVADGSFKEKNPMLELICSSSLTCRQPYTLTPCANPLPRVRVQAAPGALLVRDYLPDLCIDLAAVLNEHVGCAVPSTKKGDLDTMVDPTQPPEGEPQIRAIAMLADANPSGDIFGGWLMAQMDLAAVNAAARRSRGRCVRYVLSRAFLGAGGV